MNIISPINCHTGYGITGYNVWNELYLNNADTTLFNIGDISIEDHWNKDNIIKSLKNQDKFDSTKNCLKIWHTNDILFRPIGNSQYGCLTFFELDNIPQREVDAINLLDHIFVASEWAKNVLLSQNVTTNIIVCPQGVDRNIFTDNYIPQPKNDTYIFINIGKWEVRKGHDILYKIFNQAFSKEDNVELWMVNSNPFLKKEQTQQWINLYKNSELGEKIKIFPRLESQLQLAKLMQYVDCGIFPSRAEGWNNEAIELMSIGKPIIITNYSAHTQYCNNHNSYLVEIDTLCEARDDMWFKNTVGRWADINETATEQMIRHMRYVYEHHINTNPEGISTANQLSWTNTAKIIEKYLNG